MSRGNPEAQERNALYTLHILFVIVRPLVLSKFGSWNELVSLLIILIGAKLGNGDYNDDYDDGDDDDGGGGGDGDGDDIDGEDEDEDE